MIKDFFPRVAGAAVVAAMTCLAPGIARADEVLDWNAILMRAARAAGTPTPANTRLMAMVHAAMFDALNGVERRYEPIHVAPDAPPGASRRAAVVQAAYTTLVGLFPAQAEALTLDLDESLEAIASGAAVEHGESIARGREWGETVARAILAWRATDGFDPPAPPYLGSDAVGRWRPTPPAHLPGLTPTLGSTLPFVIPTSSSFRPAGPPSLTSLEYAEDFNEVKAAGSASSALRTPDQTEAARFWAGTAPTFWNRAAVSAALARHTTLSQNARLFALLNIAMADGGISVWESKYYSEFWRPLTAIRLAGTDGNPQTIEQADWTSLIGNPPYPEYASGHATLSGAAQAVLTAYFGGSMRVEGFSEGLPGVVRSWPSFSAVADEANESRIHAGIHFRFAVRDARKKGDEIGAYVLDHAARPLRGSDSQH